MSTSERNADAKGEGMNMRNARFIAGACTGNILREATKENSTMSRPKADPSQIGTLAPVGSVDNAGSDDRRLSELENQVEAQEESLRHVLAMLIEWFEDSRESETA